MSKLIPDKSEVIDMRQSIQNLAVGVLENITDYAYIILLAGDIQVGYPI
jgi:hypothetical protein